MKKLIDCFLMGLLVSCNYSNQHTPPNGSGAAANNGSTGNQEICEPLPSGETQAVPTFNEVRDQVFQVHCFQCHGNGGSAGGVNLETHGAAAPWAAQIKFDVVNNIMPKAPNPPVPQAGKDLVVAWVDAGAPNNLSGVDCKQPGSGNDTSPGQPDGGDTDGPFDPSNPLEEVPPDNEINYALVREKIFKISCFSCHSNAGGNVDGINLETYFNTVEEIEDIEEVIREGEMPPPPRPSIGTIPRRVLLRWIQLGAPR